MQREDQVYCNCCGRSLQKQGNMYIEEFIHIKKDWGYFSDKDGITQKADICEECLEMDEHISDSCGKSGTPGTVISEKLL